MATKTLEIHSENILPIIKKWLYSDKDIFVRELISNSIDAIHKVKVLRDQGKTEAKDEEFRIDVKIDKEKGTLKFIDTGIGMDADEVEQYIAQIAFSGAEDFVKKYETNKAEDQFIGHFGLGFYSSYMVADLVDIDTLSYKEGAKPVFWSCDGTRDYTIKKGKRKERGTEITLHIGKENEEYLDEAKIKKILEQYCAFLPYPIHLGDQHINSFEPLWVKGPSECEEKDYIEFYRHLYPFEPEPLFWVHLAADYPFHLKGILYFPKMTREYDLNKSRVKLFCNRVFVSDDCKDIIPNYLMPLRGVIESPDIPLNVSRSYLQVDKTVRQLMTHVAKKVSDSLHTLHRNDKEKFINCWNDISVVIKLGLLEDEKFYDRVKDLLIWKTVDGEWVTAEDYLEKNKEKTKDKIVYVKDEKHLAHFVDAYKKQGVDILCVNHWLDSYVMPHLEKKVNAKFQRIDASVEEALIDREREKTILDSEGKTDASKLADFVRSKIGDDHLEIEAKSLTDDTLPGFVMIDEEQRRMKEYMRQMHPDEASALPPFAKSTFVVNTNNPLIETARSMNVKDSELSTEIVKYAYELALLQQHELDPSKFNEFAQRSNKVMEKLAELASKDAKDSVIIE